MKEPRLEIELQSMHNLVCLLQFDKDSWLVIPGVSAKDYYFREFENNDAHRLWPHSWVGRQDVKKGGSPFIFEFGLLGN